jgi:hypothetical protein
VNFGDTAWRRSASGRLALVATFASARALRAAQLPVAVSGALK